MGSSNTEAAAPRRWRWVVLGFGDWGASTLGVVTLYDRLLRTEPALHTELAPALSSPQTFLHLRLLRGGTRPAPDAGASGEFTTIPRRTIPRRTPAAHHPAVGRQGRWDMPCSRTLLDVRTMSIQKDSC